MKKLGTYLVLCCMCVLIFSGYTNALSLFDKIRSQNVITYTIHDDSTCIAPHEVDIRVIMYHYVRPLHRDPVNSVVYNNSLSPEEFHGHIYHLSSLIKKDKAHAATMDDIAQWHMRGCFPHKRIVVMTADDGWRDNYHYIYNIAAYYDIPFTLGIVYDKIGYGEDRIDPFMTYEEIKHIARSDLISIQSHSMTHGDLRGMNSYAQAYELCESKLGLEKLFGITINTFIYPYGGHNQLSVELAKQCGYDYALTTITGTVRPWQLSSTPYELKRLRASKGVAVDYLFGE